IFAAGFLIHPIDKRRRETLFLSKKYSDFFHRCAAVISSEAGGEVEKPLEFSDLSKRCLDFDRHDNKPLGSWTLFVTAVTNPMQLREERNEAVLRALSRERCLN